MRGLRRESREESSAPFGAVHGEPHRHLDCAWMLAGGALRCQPRGRVARLGEHVTTISSWPGIFPRPGLPAMIGLVSN